MPCVLLRLLFVVSIVVPSLLMFPSRSHACSCSIALPTLDEMYAYSDMVFRGTLTSKGPIDQDLWVKAEFDVVIIWKGRISRTASLTIHDGTSCAYDVTVGVEYLAFASEGEIGGICGRTRLAKVEHAEEAMAALGPGRQVGQDVAYPDGGSGGLAASDTSTSTPVEALAVIGVIGVLMVGASWMGLRWWRRDVG